MRREPGEPAPGEAVDPTTTANVPSPPNPRQWGPIRDAEGAGHVELFLVATVVTITVTRLYLQATGFPQIGGAGGLHVAHVLFGGVFMLGAMVMFMLFLGRSSRWLASLFAGIGFGLFIDEVGKFLTQDNNYFFKPAAAVMYLFIVLVYVISAFLVRRRALSDRELVVNSLKMMFDPPKELQGRINMLDDMNDVINAGLRYLGLPRCNSNPEDLKKVNALLQQAKPYWRTMSYDTITKTVSKDVDLSQVWNGAAMRARLQRPTMHFVFPKEGATKWMDNVAVLKGAANMDNAKLFQDFIMDPENAALIWLSPSTTTASSAARSTCRKRCRKRLKLST